MPLRSQGGRMFGLFKQQQKAPQVAEDDVDSAEAEAAMLIKARSEVGKLVASRLDDPTEDQADQRARYESIRDECLARADKIEDEFYRAFAIHQIIDLCMAAKEPAVARALLLAVQDDFVREKIFLSAPELKD